MTQTTIDPSGLSVTHLLKLDLDCTDPSIPDAAYIALHLTEVEALLRSCDASVLPKEQQARRAEALDNLHTYIAEGEFPVNLDFPGRRVPYFVDAKGTFCAMAHLIHESGSAGLVERVAKTCNNAKVKELENDPELIGWLAANGMTAEEAALVQPTYRVPAPSVRAKWMMQDPSINKVENDRKVGRRNIYVMNRDEAIDLKREVLAIPDAGQGGLWEFPEGYKSALVKQLVKMNKNGKLKLNVHAAKILNNLRSQVEPAVTEKFVASKNIG